MKKISLLILFLSTITNLIAQITNLIPPSPNASAIAKYGEIPVSLYTGTPNISVPFFEIKVGEVSIPIGVNYHASGLKVEEIASNVGVGWSLSAGGLITRTIRGLADEDESFGYFNQTTDLSSMLSSSTSLEAKATFFNQVQIGEQDAEPDVYYLNLGGLSGKFLVDKTTKEGYNLQASNIKIKWIVADNQWIVTDEHGIRYFFGKAYKGDLALTVERAQYRSSTYANINGQSGENRNGSKLFNYPNAWMLKQILLPNGEQIDFSYISYQTEYCTVANEMTSYSIGEPDSQCGILSANQKTVQKITTFGKKISSIQFTNGSVVFEYLPTARLDINTTDNALQKVTLKDANNAEVKSFRLSHNYFSLDPSSSFTVFCTPPTHSKLKLEQIQEHAPNGNCLPPYIFSYEAGNLPNHTAMTQDHWGFHNGQNNLTLIPEFATPILGGRIFNLLGAKRFSDFTYGKIGTLNKIQYPTGGETLFEYESHEVFSQDFPFEAQLSTTEIESESIGSSDVLPGERIAEKSLSISSADIHEGILGQWVKVNTFSGSSNCHWGIRGEGGCGTEFSLRGTGIYYSLSGMSNQKIFVPAGSYILRIRILDPEYAPDDLQCDVIKLISSSASINVLHNKKVGGLRIKKITNKEAGNIVSITKYKYTLPDSSHTTSSGVLYQVPTYHYVGYGMVREIVSTIHSSFIYLDICSELVRFSSSQLPVTHGQGSHVEYRYVEEIKVENEASENGLKTAYSFSTSLDFPDENNRGFPFPPPTTFEWKRGRLLSQIEYRYQSDIYTPIRETTFNYTIGDNRYTKSTIGLRTGCLAHGTGTFGATCLDAYFGVFTIASGWSYLKEKTEKIYDQNSPNQFVLTKDIFTYNNPNYLQLSTHQWIDSKSVEVSNEHNRYKRIDYTYAYDYPTNSLYQDMVTRNILSLTDETKSLQVNNVNTLLTKKATQFKLWNQGTTYDGLDGFYAPEKTQTWINQIDNSHLAETVDFINYDSKANLLEFIRNGGAPTTLTWYSNGGKANLVHTQKIASGTGAEQITTFNYKPLVGVSSITKPNTSEYTYTYDNFNRLFQVSGPEGIEQEISYFYSTSATCLNSNE